MAQARDRDVGTEEVEQVVAAIAGCLGEQWVAVDLQQSGELVVHQHPPGCPTRFKATFQGKLVLTLPVKGKFKCGNPGCQRSWSSARSLLLISVKPTRMQYRFSISALEQGCQRCGRDVYCRMYVDEAERVAEWLTNAYQHQEYPERQQRHSNMRRPHDKKRCAACRAGLH